MYETSAENFAVGVLANNERDGRTPDEFIDLVIVAKRDYVIFSEHEYGGRGFTAGYFPLANPSSTGGDVGLMDWNHLHGKWYELANSHDIE